MSRLRPRSALALSARLPIALEPGRNLPARQPVLGEAHIAHPVEPVLNLPVSAQALQGLLHAQMLDATASNPNELLYLPALQLRSPRQPAPPAAQPGPAVLRLQVSPKLASFLKPKLPDLKPAMALCHLAHISRPAKAAPLPQPQLNRLLQFWLVALDRP